MAKYTKPFNRSMYVLNFMFDERIAMIQLFGDVPTITSSIIMQCMQCSRPTALATLKHLCDMKLVKKYEIGRVNHYELTEWGIKWTKRNKGYVESQSLGVYKTMKG